MTRLVALKNVSNLRDLGGYPTVDGHLTRWRTLYRSDSLHGLDEPGQLWLLDAGLRTIVDLRGDDEVASLPNVFAKSTRLAYRHMPLWNTPLPDDMDPDLREGYIRELQFCGAQLAAIFRAVVAPDALPALVHCAAGKDRTGVVIGLLLEAAGVTREVIAEDYALSSVYLGPEYVAHCRVWIAELGRDWERWAHTVETPPERMLKTLTYLDTEFGGIEAYLARYGLMPEHLAQLRRLLVDDTEPTPGA